MGAMATCCPTRQALSGGYCKAHDPRTLVLVTEPQRPPAVCPKCHAPPPGWHGTAEYMACMYCGEDWEQRAWVVGR